MSWPYPESNIKYSKELIYNLHCSTCRLSKSLLILTSTYYYVLLVATCSNDTLCISVKIQFKKKIQTYIYVVNLHSIINATLNHGIYSTIGRSVDQRFQFSRNCSNRTLFIRFSSDLMIYFNFNTPMPILCIVAPIFKDKI